MYVTFCFESVMVSVFVHFRYLNGIYFIPKVVSIWYLLDTKWNLDTWLHPWIDPLLSLEEVHDIINHKIDITNMDTNVGSGAASQQ